MLSSRLPTLELVKEAEVEEEVKEGTEKGGEEEENIDVDVEEDVKEVDEPSPPMAEDIIVVIR